MVNSVCIHMQVCALNHGGIQSKLISEFIIEISGKSSVSVCTHIQVNSYINIEKKRKQEAHRHMATSMDSSLLN